MTQSFDPQCGQLRCCGVENETYNSSQCSCLTMLVMVTSTGSPARRLSLGCVGLCVAIGNPPL